MSKPPGIPKPPTMVMPNLYPYRVVEPVHGTVRCTTRTFENAWKRARLNDRIEKFESGVWSFIDQRTPAPRPGRTPIYGENMQPVNIMLPPGLLSAVKSQLAQKSVPFGIWARETLVDAMERLLKPEKPRGGV